MLKKFYRKPLSEHFKKATMKQHLTHLILDMIGEDKTFPELESDAYDDGYAKALQDIREKVQEIAERIDNEFYKPVEYNTAQKYVLKTALENFGEMDDEQYEFIRNNLLDRFK